jgi:cysteine synthase
MKFDSKNFELLKGIAAASYAIEMIKNGIEEKDILPYLQEKAEFMDVTHLELVVGMVGSVGTTPAFQEVAKYLDHPNFNIKFVAVKTLKNMASVDEMTMELIVASLSKNDSNTMSKSLLQELKVALNRPANENARRVAQDYLDRSACGGGT